MARILLIEDDASVAESLQRVLEAENHRVMTAASGEQGLAEAKRGDFDVVVTDFQMPGISGLEVITKLHRVKTQLPIILMTAHHSTETAIEATKLGAYDYILKPIDHRKFPEFFKMIEKAAASKQLMERQVKLPGEHALETAPAGDAIIGNSSLMQTVYKEIGRVAAKPVTVLIRGETGTGKELVARALYQHSDRAGQPFIVVNCVAIPETLLESELFGHEQGAFTGAQTRRIGKFEQANQGTIFLDEIGDMSLGTQAKLLRVLQEKTLQRVGGKETIKVDVRVLAATHRDLEQAVKEKQFREDLYYRLNDAAIHLPSLRERREDIPRLVEYFLNPPGAGLAARIQMPPDSMRLLMDYSWTGNVRELKNVVHQAILLAQGYSIDTVIIHRVLGQINLAQPATKSTLPAYVASLVERADRDAPSNLAAALLEWVERELYGQAIRLAERDQSKVAKWLGVSRPTVHERLVRYGLHPASERGATSS